MAYMESIDLVLTKTADPNRRTPKWVGLQRSRSLCQSFEDYVQRVTAEIPHPSFKYLSSNIGQQISPLLQTLDCHDCQPVHKYGFIKCREGREDWRLDVIHLLDNLPTFTTYLGRSA